MPIANKMRKTQSIREVVTGNVPWDLSVL